MNSKYNIPKWFDDEADRLDEEADSRNRPRPDRDMLQDMMRNKEITTKPQLYAEYARVIHKSPGASKELGDVAASAELTKKSRFEEVRQTGIKSRKERKDDNKEFLKGEVFAIWDEEFRMREPRSKLKDIAKRLASSKKTSRGYDEKTILRAITGCLQDYRKRPGRENHTR